MCFPEISGASATGLFVCFVGENHRPRMRPVTECWTGKNSSKCLLARQRNHRGRDLFVECCGTVRNVSNECGARQPQERTS